MNQVSIDNIGSDSVGRAELLLRDIPGAADKAIKSAAERTAKHLHTSSSRIIREIYAISAAVLRDKDTAKVYYSIWNGAGITIKFAGHRIPLYKFDGSSPKQPVIDSSQKKIRAFIQGKWRSVYPSLPARGHAKKATRPYVFKNAFVAEIQNTNGNNHIGIFERNGGVSESGGDAISEIMGLSFPQMIGNSEVKEKLRQQAEAKFEQRIEHEISAFINGWRR